MLSILKLILDKYGIHSIDYFENIEVFQAGVNPVIFNIGQKDYVTITRKSIRRNDFKIIKTNYFLNIEELKSLSINSFRKEFIDITKNLEIDYLGNICYISYCLRPNSDERFWKGEFKTKDVVRNNRDKIFCKPFIEGKDIDAYLIKKIRFLEWGTDRVPNKISRPTFPELYNPPKLIRGRMNPAIYDESEIINLIETSSFYS